MATIPPEKYDKLTPKDKNINKQLNEKKTSSGGGGGSNGNANNYGQRPANKFAKPTTEEETQGFWYAKDSNGELLDPLRQEWWCSKCKGEREGEKGSWAKTHGDKHPKNKHQDNFVWRRKGNNQQASIRNSGSGSSNNITTLAVQPPLPEPRFDEVKQAPEPESELEDPNSGVSETSYMFGYPTISLNDPVAAFDAYKAMEDQE